MADSLPMQWRAQADAGVAIDTAFGCEQQVRNAVAKTLRRCADEYEVAVPRCDQCRWWDGPGEVYGTGVCLRVPGAMKNMTTSGQPGDSQNIWTSPDFGCVQWERKT